MTPSWSIRLRRRLWHSVNTAMIYNSWRRGVFPPHNTDIGIRYSRVDRGRGQIALPFPPVPLQTVLATFMAHGSLVSLYVQERFGCAHLAYLDVLSMRNL